MMEKVAQQGTLVASLIALGGLLGVLLRSLLPYRKSMIDALRDRVEVLESALEVERTSRAAEVALLRHRVANAEHALDLFIELIEAQPERAAHHAAKIKAKRHEDREILSKESATLRAAEIVRAGQRPHPRIVEEPEE